MPRAENLHDQARRAVNRGAFSLAIRLLDLAESATDDPVLVARIELTRAYADAETGQPTAALERCLELLERELPAATLGLVWAQLGLLHMRSGEGDAAVTAFQRALTLLPPEEHLERGRVFLNRGNVHLQRGRVRESEADFSTAREQFDRGGAELERAKAEHNLGYARLVTGDLVGAMQMIDEAAVLLSPLSPAYRATVEQDRAEVLTAAGRPQEATQALQAAAAAYGSRRLRTSQAECELILAWTLLREDPPQARSVARRAARRFRTQASPARAAQADAVALVAEIATGATTPGALARLDALVTELRRQGNERDAVVLELQGARASLVRGDLASARGRAQQVRLHASSPVTTRLLWREVRAELALARGDRRRAHQHVRAGLTELHAWQSTFGSLDLQSTLVGHGRDLAVCGLETALDDGDPGLVLEWSERARALVSRVAPVRAPSDAQVADDLTELRLLQAGRPQRHTPEARRVGELQDRVRRRQLFDGGGGAVGEPAGLEDVRSRLAMDHAALVAFVAVRDRITAVVVTDAVARVLPLGDLSPVRDQVDALTADLAMAASHRSDDLARPLRASLHARLDRVAAQLVAPLAEVVGDRRAVLTPSGALAGTPWSLLPGLRGRPLTIPPSATRWLELRARPDTPTRGVGLVAGPGVDRAEEEVTRAASAWPHARVLRGADATAGEVAALASDVGLLHLAGHGRHTSENPLFSAVRLADGPWFGYDIDQLDHVPDTVVLSACELGRVSVRSGEESVGMSAAWLHAGACTVLSSPVPIADDVACEVLARWHALVATGARPADALAEVSTGADDVVPLLSFGAGW